MRSARRKMERLQSPTYAKNKPHPGFTAPLMTTLRCSVRMEMLLDALHPLSMEKTEHLSIVYFTKFST